MKVQKSNINLFSGKALVSTCHDYLLPIFLVMFFILAASHISYAFEVMEYGGHELKWPESDMPLPYKINQNGSDDVTTTKAFSAVRASFQTWTDIDGSFLAYDDDGLTSNDDTDGMDGQYILVWRETSSDWYWDSRVIAVCVVWFMPSDGTIIEADIEFNGINFTWDTDGSSSAMDIQNIGTHEIGHFGGLADLYDSGDSEKTMYGYSSKGDTSKRTLHQDDIDGMRYLYPGVATGDVVKPDTVILSAPSGIVTDTISATFMYSGSDNVTDTNNLVYAYMLYDYDYSYSGYTSNTIVTYDSLPNGRYTFYVKAMDEAGNIDDTPAEAGFTINFQGLDEDPPVTTIDEPPDAVVNSNIVTIGFSGTDNRSNPSKLLFSTYLEGHDPGFTGYASVNSRTYLSLEDGLYTFKVKARDEAWNMEQIPAEVSFTIDFGDAVNQTPIAEAGDDQIVYTDRQVSLNAFGSSDPENDKLLYTWTQALGTAVTLSDADTARPYFNVPDNKGISFDLTVTDGLNESESDTVYVYSTDYIMGKGTVTQANKVLEIETGLGSFSFDFTSANMTENFINIVIGQAYDYVSIDGDDFAIGELIELEPEGYTFDGNVTVKFPYTDDMLVTYPPENLRLYFYDEASDSYLQKTISSIDTAAKTVTFSTDKFTKYQLAISTGSPSGGGGGGGGGCFIAEASYKSEDGTVTKFVLDLIRSVYHR